jgi:YD repeat-containing protein
MSFGYDAQGNQTSINAPLSRNTSNQFDALNRLVQITDPGNGMTQFRYDTNDNLTTVVDPRSLTTGYTYNGFGDLVQQSSPDTGTTVSAYDSGGNLATSTDARSQTGTYTYDAQNRVTQVAYGDRTITFGYDSGTNGVGRLTSAGDANHSLGWSYDALGRVVGKTQIVGSGATAITKSVGYTYTNGDLTSLVTPSGQTLTYGYTNGQITSIAVNGNALLSQVLYEPFGPVSGWTWANNTNEARVYDESGHLLGEYDGSGNIIEETVWMGDVPVATLQPNGTGVSVYYVHADHLNTPRRFTSPSTNAIV